jgi:predicted nucleotidyltransferase
MLEPKVLEKGIEIVQSHLGDNHLLYMAVSGSHVWGLDRPDSDVDFRGVYQKPTTQILGMNRGRDTIEFTDGLYDVQLYEIEKFLSMLCNHNGNMVNLLWLNPCLSRHNVDWDFLSKSFLTKSLRKYYRGYAESQRKRAMSCRGGKALIYTYREMFSGLFAMHFRYVEHNFMTLWGTALTHGWYTGELLGKYMKNPQMEITDEGWRQFYAEWDELCLRLDEEASKSSLPETFDGTEYCNKHLIAMRLNDLHL